MKKASPYLVLLFGILSLFYLGNVYVAGVLIILGIVMIFERIWPSVKDE